MTSVFQWVYTLPQRNQADSTQAPAAKGDRGISDRIAQAFDAASDSTGTSFDYLLTTAQRESSLNPMARARTSSAAGLFQFIESTWLQTLKEAGADHGLGWVADKIAVDERGRYSVEDDADRQAILDLRLDPDIASMMAGAFTRKNADYLSEKLGRAPNAGELYIAHFLGARGASEFIHLAETAPDAVAATHFPRQAGANKSIFYESGKPLSMAAVYADLVARHGGTGPAMLLPEDGASSATTLLAFDQADPANRVASGWRAAESEDAFSGLFRSGTTGGGQPLAASASSASANTTGFFSSFAVAPALFQIAMDEDARALLSAAEPLPDPIDPGPSLVERASDRKRDERRKGPLDLSQFLRIEQG